MHPRITELFDHLDRERKTLDAAIASVPESLHATAPGPDRWSVAQIVEHLATTEQRIARLFMKLIAEAKTQGLAAESSVDSVLASFNTARIVDRSYKIVNPSAAPSGTMTPVEGAAALDDARAAFKAAVLQGDGLDLSRISAPHPAFGPLNLYEWTAFVGSHMTRHADQIREAGRELTA